VKAVGVFFLVALAAAAPAHAAEGGDSLLGWKIANFVLLVTVLVLALRKPLQKFFADRRGAIHTDIEEAAALRKAAEERHSQWQRRLANLERELDEIRATSRERADAEREHLLADARAAAERIRRDAENAVDQELRRARARLRDEASELAVELAAGILREQVGPADRDRLLDEFIGRIERSPEKRS
jgi:F-type H+-transporting ATPase subunit b